MRKSVIIASMACIMIGLSATAQQGMAFQHLRNATFQSTNFNPAYMPDGVLFIGLPGISGVSGYFNNRFSYNDLYTDNESGGKLLNIDNAISELGINNLISAHANVSLLHLGLRLPSGHAFVLFANERVESDITYPENLMKWAWEGNGEYIGRDVNFSKLGVSANYFREYGLAYAFENEPLGLKFGARLKMYQGLVNISTPASLTMKVLTENENFQVNLENKNAVLRTAGYRTLQEGDNIVNYLISNSNRGFGLDLGFEKRLNRYYSFALAVTDIGYISWNEGIRNFEIADTTFRYTGVELKGIRDLASTVQDSLLDKFSVNRNTDTYRTLAVARANGHFIYKPLPYLDVITSASARMIQGQPKMGYGLGLRGYLGPKLIVSGSLTRMPQQFVNVGAGFTLGAGPVQLYAAVDKVIGYSVPNMQWAEARVGLNFVFGNKTRYREQRIRSRQASEERVITEPKGVVSGTFMGSKIPIKKAEGLYTFIPKQEKHDVGTITPYVINGDREPVRNQSATGANRTEHAPRGVKSATGLNRSNHAPRSVQSASGRVFKNDYKAKQVGSVTGAKKKIKKKKKKIRSASGGRSSGVKRKKSKVRSASGRRGN